MRFLSLLGVALAAVIGANGASGGFVLIDDFVGATEFPRVTVITGGSPSVSLGGGQLVTSGSPTFLRLTYDLGGYDLLQANGYVIRLDGLSVTTATNLVVDARLNGVMNATTYSLNSGFNGSLTFDFSSLGGSLSSANELRIRFGSQVNTDPFSLSLGNVQAVPEPTTLALIGLASAGGGFAGWRRKRLAKSALS